MKNARFSLLLSLLPLLFSSMSHVIAYQYLYVTEKQQISAGLIIGGEQPVGGIWKSPNKFELLAPYIGLTLTTIIATAVTVVYIKYRKKQ